jgi:hypothetical protein
MVQYPRVFSSRELRRIVPALGAISICLLAGALLFPQSPIDPAPEAEAAGVNNIGLRGSYLSDIGPHTTSAFAPREARSKPQYRFVAEAEAATPAPLARTPEPPTPPARPSELRNAGVATIVEPPHVTVDVPTPPHRPTELSAALLPAAPKEQPLAARQEPAPRRISRLEGATAVPAAPADNRGFFERLFGGAPQAAGPGSANRREAMAYANPSDPVGLFGGLHSAVAPSNPSARFDRYTAVYDISARTVYMPSGQRLEAHSGLREHLDDPRYVHLRMRGPTPPHLYDLRPREALFHGVEALRLNPVGGGGAIYNRAGLLAHTYMLGPNGDSNGCVSFRDYEAFLNAYKRGEIRRLAVVSHL